ncbi:domain found in IF2B/IF5-domain-containing protein [Zopfochytrium polystomum]|nr:domain found in IF2B/IF5-domain-containing protein [Zopfochytrium polystomum]
MSVLNIGGDSKDAFYRYKMPKLISKIEGKGNGIKTVIPNMSEIAKALSRPPTYPTKFFANELGTSATFIIDKDRYIINGAHDATKLQNLLEVFITKFVLCPACKNPETNLIISGDNITRDCQACGANLPVDMRHKLCVFILKNPPPVKKSKAEKAIAKRQIKGGNTVPTDEGNQSDGGDNDDDELARRIAKEASLLDDVEVDEEDWGRDTSAEAVAARQKQNAALSLTKSDIEEEAEAFDPLEAFADFVLDEKPADPEIIAKAKELKLKDRKVCAVLAQILFDNDVLPKKQIDRYTPLLKSFTKDEKCQKALIGGLERFVSSKKSRDVLMPKVAQILKAFYDAELIDEDVILEWAENPSDKYVKQKYNDEIRQKAEPFVNWLRAAEEDEDDE